MTTISAAYPEVHAAIVATAKTALNNIIRVVDGYDVSEDPDDVMMIGVPSLTDTTTISAGSFTQETLSYGAAGARREEGTINGCVLASNGDGEQAIARANAFDYVNQLGAALRADCTMGVTAFSLDAQVRNGEVLEDQQDGAMTGISFTVAYTAII